MARGKRSGAARAWAPSPRERAGRAARARGFEEAPAAPAPATRPAAAAAALAARAQGGPATPAAGLLGQPPWPGPRLAGLGPGERVLPGLHHDAPALGAAEP